MYFPRLESLYKISERARNNAAVECENARRLSLMENLEENWDGCGGKAFRKSTIAIFRAIIKGISHQTEILPTNMGAMGMIFRKHDGSYMEFEVFPDRVEMFFVPLGDAESVKGATEYISAEFVGFINGWLKILYG